MQVLVTGGSGFIGGALCARLQADGHAVTVLTRDPARTARAVPGVRAVATLDGLGGIDAVVNLAGEPLADGRWTDARKQAFRDSRLDTTRALLAWMANQATPPTVLVSGSAIGYYGPRGDNRLDESAPPADDFAARLCDDWESAAREATALGVRVCTVRIGVVLHPDGGALAKMLPPFRLGAGGPMGTGKQWMSWITRDDLVSLLVFLLGDAEASGAYNGTAPEPVRNEDFARALGAALHRPALLRTPALALKALFGEMSGLLLTGQRVVPARAQVAGFAFAHPTLDAALASLLR